MTRHAPYLKECFTIFYNAEDIEVVVKKHKDFGTARSDPVDDFRQMEFIMENVISKLEFTFKKMYKKAVKVGFDPHVGCSSWPCCDEAPGGCDLYNQSFEDDRDLMEPPRWREFKELNDSELHRISITAVNAAREGCNHFGEELTLDVYRKAVATVIQAELKALNS